MSQAAFIDGRRIFALTLALEAEHGEDAAMAAVARAARSRSCDNAVMFTRWREAERLMCLPLTPEEGQRLH